MPGGTNKTIVIRQIEQFLIAASTIELILDLSKDRVVGSGRLESKDPDERQLAPLEMIEFFETIYLTINSLAATTYLQAEYSGKCF